MVAFNTWCYIPISGAHYVVVVHRVFNNTDIHFIHTNLYKRSGVLINLSSSSSSSRSHSHNKLNTHQFWCHIDTNNLGWCKQIITSQPIYCWTPCYMGMVGPSHCTTSIYSQNLRLPRQQVGTPRRGMGIGLIRNFIVYKMANTKRFPLRSRRIY